MESCFAYNRKRGTRRCEMHWKIPVVKQLLAHHLAYSYLFTHMLCGLLLWCWWACKRIHNVRINVHAINTARLSRRILIFVYPNSKPFIVLATILLLFCERRKSAKRNRKLYVQTHSRLNLYETLSSFLITLVLGTWIFQMFLCRLQYIAGRSALMECGQKEKEIKLFVAAN